jgi:hypothetical protein
MKRLLFALAAATALSSIACAADMSVKAMKGNFLVFPYNGSGMYWGIATKAGVEQDSASGSLLGTSLLTGNVNAAGGGIGGTIGYMHGMGTTWVAYEGTAYYQNITAAAPATNSAISVPVSFATRWSAEQVVKIGGWNPLSWLGSFGGFQFPTLPTPPTVPGISIIASGHTYISAGVEEWGVNGQFFTAGSSVTVGIAPLVGAGIMNQIVDASGKLTGAVLDVGAQVVFADKGISVSGLFAPGAPVVGALNSGRKYEAYAKVDF